MDTHGLPFDLIMDLLREKQMGFDVEGFLIACQENPNYGIHKGVKILTQYNDKPDVVKLIQATTIRILEGV